MVLKSRRKSGSHHNDLDSKGGKPVDKLHDGTEGLVGQYQMCFIDNEPGDLGSVDVNKLFESNFESFVLLVVIPNVVYREKNVIWHSG
jgi:hypothetical protein